MPRTKIYGYLACFLSFVIGILFIQFALINSNCYTTCELSDLSNYSYYSISIPIVLIALSLLSVGFWIGWTILTIKVVPPMPEIVEKKDNSKTKALFLCLMMVFLASVFIYGVFQKSYWALAIPASAITLVLLGMIFWVGIAIITARSTLPEENK